MHYPTIMPLQLKTAAFLILLAAKSSVSAVGDDYTFKFGYNFFASSTGYFEVENFKGVQPELAMEVCYLMRNA
jgi:hypothetical protein